MYESDFFPRIGQDAPSRFWSTYERVAKQHDEEFLERHNGELDVLLIFVRVTASLTIVPQPKYCPAIVGWSVLCSQLRIYRRHEIQPGPPAK